MTKHILKIEERWFDRVASGEKTSELRSCEDRDFQVGDTLLLRVQNEREKQLEVKVTHVLREAEGLEKGYAILSFKKVSQ